MHMHTTLTRIYKTNTRILFENKAHTHTDPTYICNLHAHVHREHITTAQMLNPTLNRITPYSQLSISTDFTTFLVRQYHRFEYPPPFCCNEIFLCILLLYTGTGIIPEGCALRPPPRAIAMSGRAEEYPPPPG